MDYSTLPIALSESQSLVWANEAQQSEDYFCAGCGALLYVDNLGETFIHPAKPLCSASKTHQKTALLYLEQILQYPESRLQITVNCGLCESVMLLDIRGRAQLITIPDKTEALLVESWSRLLFLMRPSTLAAREFAGVLAAGWLEVDARNVISGGPVAILNRAIADWTCEACKTHSSL